jgi:2-dehydro-3-deoxyphosphogluconate aldolase/(4S)-4-hydroxy-2-oxoglutarate aldolase
MNALEVLARCPIVPVVIIDRAEDAIPMAEALIAGGMPVAEFTFRTPAAPKALKAVRERFPEFLAGAGTVISLDGLKAALDAGACFGVSPGLNPRVVTAAREAGLPFFPGVSSPTEIEAGLELGAKILKFFPVEAIGGIRTMKAMAAPFLHTGLKFHATGLLESHHVKPYLAEEVVYSIGGPWMVAPALLRDRDWASVTRLAAATMADVRAVRPLAE